MRINVDDLIENKLVYVRKSPCGKYRLLKYTRKVFYDNLWHLDNRLLECRGIVVDEEDNVIMHPFTKVFNLGENGVGEDIPDNKEVLMVRKINGYLAQAAMINGELIVTSSGSFDSNHALIAKDMINNCLLNSQIDLCDGFTYMFEICHKEDPHIVEELEGVYLIGARCMTTGVLASPKILHAVSYAYNFEYAEYHKTTFSEAVQHARNCPHEGYMILDADTDETLVKVKSQYYLCKKALMRIGSAQLDMMFDNPKVFKENRLEEEFYGIHQFIIDNFSKDQYRVMKEQERRKLIEDYFNDNYM